MRGHLILTTSFVVSCYIGKLLQCHYRSRDWLPQSSFGTQNGIEASSPKKMDKRREPKQGGLHRGREARGGQGNEASLLLDIDDDVAGLVLALLHYFPLPTCILKYSHMTDLRLDTPSLMTPRKIGGRPIDLETASALKTLLLGEHPMSTSSLSLQISPLHLFRKCNQAVS